MASDNKNLESQRREENGVVYFDRGTRDGRDGMKYDRFAIQTHFVEVGEDASALLEKYSHASRFYVASSISSQPVFSCFSRRFGLNEYVYLSPVPFTLIFL